MRVAYYVLLGILITAGTLVSPVGIMSAENTDQGSTVEGTGFSLFDMESIKGFDETKVEKDPVCDRSRRPSISKVEPDEATPGEKITIKGENFGTKECFHGVTFSAASKEKVDYKFLNETTIEATVPEVKAGMSFIIVVAGGGSAQSKPLLIKSK
ncbi:MAG TPA: IPT/TIG domain-containing protein [Nitrospiraceae bacterium]|nr:IPT/TIG domain-containing protein [Nitrospiraceae bacterium]